MSTISTPPNPVRLDKWLWCTRLFKTRQLAMDGCRLKRVLVAGQEVKPAHHVQVGDVYEVQQTEYVKVIRVKALLHQRVAGKQVEDYVEDLTPLEVLNAAKERREALRLAPAVAPAFRPDKRDRELIKKFFEPKE